MNSLWHPAAQGFDIDDDETWRFLYAMAHYLAAVGEERSA